ncbi:MAG TPA: glycoside hydrolase domain-containing protein, partial [Bacteroidales bacterium]|nr:glycoside hydrolase domain-containing protein [Bacteroidales bacterium]
MRNFFSFHKFRNLFSFIILILFVGTPVHSQSFKLYGVSDLVRVFEDGYKLPALKDTVKIFGIRGEVISGQFVISAKKDLADISVSAGEFLEKDRKTILPASAVQCNFVGSIPVEKNTPNQPASVIVRQAPARFPEYLMTDGRTSIKKRMWQPVWLTIDIPADAIAGKYTGNITVRSEQESQSLPVSITVYPISIPEKRHLKVVEWMSTGGFERFYGIKEKYSPSWYEMLGVYAANMAAHRQNVFQV